MNERRNESFIDGWVKCLGELPASRDRKTITEPFIPGISAERARLGLNTVIVCGGSAAGTALTLLPHTSQALPAKLQRVCDWMAELFLQISVSLDGFIEDCAPDLSWFTEDTSLDELPTEYPTRLDDIPRLTRPIDVER